MSIFTRMLGGGSGKQGNDGLSLESGEGAASSVAATGAVRQPVQTHPWIAEAINHARAHTSEPIPFAVVIDYVAQRIDEKFEQDRTPEQRNVMLQDIASNVSGANMRAFIFTKNDMDRIGGELNASGTVLDHCVFRPLTTLNAIKTDSATSMIGVQFDGMSLESEALHIERSRDCSFSSFQGAQGAHVEIDAGVKAWGLNLRGAKLAKVHVGRGADLSEIDMSEAHVIEMHANSAILDGGNFAGTTISMRGSFEQAAMVRTNFSGAAMRNVNFRGAQLIQADMTNADVKGADFRGANLRGAFYMDAQQQKQSVTQDWLNAQGAVTDATSEFGRAESHQPTLQALTQFQTRSYQVNQLRQTARPVSAAASLNPQVQRQVAQQNNMTRMAPQPGLNAGMAPGAQAVMRPAMGVAPGRNPSMQPGMGMAPRPQQQAVRQAPAVQPPAANRPQPPQPAAPQQQTNLSAMGVQQRRGQNVQQGMGSAMGVGAGMQPAGIQPPAMGRPSGIAAPNITAPPIGPANPRPLDAGSIQQANQRLANQARANANATPAQQRQTVQQASQAMQRRQVAGGQAATLQAAQQNAPGKEMPNNATKKAPQEQIPADYYKKRPQEPK